MFTGLIERTATLRSLSEENGITTMVVEPAGGEAFTVTHGASVAVNGCCLTVTAFDEKTLTFEVSRETLACTNMHKLQEGSRVNLERALRVGDRLGGHMVSGHVDGTGILTTVHPADDGWYIEVLIPAELAGWVIPKGSVCLDGISLTVNGLKDREDGCLIDLMLIPTTLDETTFRDLKEGWTLNLEMDLVGKYIARLARLAPGGGPTQP